MVSGIPPYSAFQTPYTPPAFAPVRPPDTASAPSPQFSATILSQEEVKQVGNEVLGILTKTGQLLLAQAAEALLIKQRLAAAAAH